MGVDGQNVFINLAMWWNLFQATLGTVTKTDFTSPKIIICPANYLGNSPSSWIRCYLWTNLYYFHPQLQYEHQKVIFKVSLRGQGRPSNVYWIKIASHSKHSPICQVSIIARNLVYDKKTCTPIWQKSGGQAMGAHHTQSWCLYMMFVPWFWYCNQLYYIFGGRWFSGLNYYKPACLCTMAWLAY